MFGKKTLLVLLSVLGMVALLLACAAEEEEATPAPGETPTGPEPTATRVVLPTATPTPVGGVEKTQGGVLRLASSAYEPPNWDPTTFSYKTHYMLNLVHAFLINHHYGTDYSSWNFDLTSDGLAESWEVSDGGLTYTFHIKKGVKFQDRPPVNGRELTAEDVKWSYEHLVSKGSMAFKFEVVDYIECPDKYTLVIHLKEPRAAFMLYVADPQCEVVPKETMELEGDLKKWYTAVGAGPFEVVSSMPDVAHIFQRDPNYYRAGEGLPYVDEVRLLVVPDSSTTLAAFRAGNLDIRSISRTDLESIKATNPNIHCSESELGSSGLGIAMRTDMPPYTDVRVRQAISMALDRQAIINSSYLGYGIEQHGPLCPDHPDYLKEQGECAKYGQYNPEEAKRLLSEAGYPDGFKDTLTATPGYGTSVMEYGELIIDMLAKVGIELTYELQDYAAFVGTSLLGKYEGMFWGYVTSDPDPDDVLIPKLAEPWTAGSRNNSHVDDPVLREMIYAQSTALNEEERKEILYDIQKYLACQRYYIFWPRSYGITCSQPWCYGYKVHAGFRSFGRIHEVVWMTEDAPNRKLELTKDTFPYEKFK